MAYIKVLMVPSRTGRYRVSACQCGPPEYKPLIIHKHDISILHNELALPHHTKYRISL